MNSHIQVNAMAETMKKVQKQTKSLLASQQKQRSSTAGQLDSMSGKLAELEAMFAALLEMCRRRQALLEDSLAFYQLVQDLQEEAQWLDEKTAICAAPIQVGELWPLPAKKLSFGSSLIFALPDPTVVSAKKNFCVPAVA